MASRNGLNPKIRGRKGLGFGRSLPAPFGFDLSFKGNGNDYFTFPSLLGTQVPDAITIEFWLKPLNSTPPDFASVFGFKTSTNVTTSLFTSSKKIALSPQGIANQYCETLNFGSWNHLVFICDFANGIMRCVTNGNISNAAAGFTAFAPATITSIALCGTVGGGVYNEPVDEFRVYNKVISELEITTNYNMGVGNNPAITEDLLLWYKFEQFEMLDFSTLQDNSDLKIGIRDLSGKNNHILPKAGMNTDPASSTYVLQAV